MLNDEAMRKVILPKGMIELFRNLGSVIFTKRKAFYYFPFWISVDEETGEPRFMAVSYTHLTLPTIYSV